MAGFWNPTRSPNPDSEPLALLVEEATAELGDVDDPEPPHFAELRLSLLCAAISDPATTRAPSPRSGTAAGGGRHGVRRGRALAALRTPGRTGTGGRGSRGRFRPRHRVCAGAR